MAAYKQTAASAVTLLTTELNSLADNTGVLSSVAGGTGAFNNVSTGTANLDGALRGHVQLLLKAGAAAWSSDGCVKLWFVRAADGTNYEGQPPRREADVIFFPAATTSDQRVIGLDGLTRRPIVDLPAGLWKVYYLPVALGQAHASSANVVIVQAITDNTV